MATYVDDALTPYRRMLMCHMLADTEAELHEMADRIGIARRWYQGDHDGICQAKRALAVRFGAVEISRRQAVVVRRAIGEHTSRRNSAGPKDKGGPRLSLGPGT